jgi:hypothetical protein
MDNDDVEEIYTVNSPMIDLDSVPKTNNDRKEYNRKKYTKKQKQVNLSIIKKSINKTLQEWYKIIIVALIIKFMAVTITSSTLIDHNLLKTVGWVFIGFFVYNVFKVISQTSDQ